MQTDLFPAFPDECGITREATHIPGPYRGRVMGDTDNIRLISVTTRETIAFVISREWGDYQNAPDGLTALKNFQLLRHAPDLLEHLQKLIDKADDLMAAIDGATDQFDPEVAALRRATGKAGKIIKAARGES